MAEYGKKLHVIKNGVEEEITLYDDKSEASENALCLLDGATPVYAALGDVTDSEASSLRVLYNGQTYSVLKEVASGGPLGLRLAAEGGGYGTWEYADLSKIADLDPVLNNNSWEQISLAAQLGIADWIWNVGDVKMIELNGRIGNNFTADHLQLGVFILDFNHADNGVAENNIIFGGFKSSLSGGKDVALVDWNDSKTYGPDKTDGTKMFNFNHLGNNNHGGWKGSDLRYDILGATSTAPSGYGAAKQTSCVGYDATAATLTRPKAGTFLAALPSDLRSKIRLRTHYVDNKGNGSNVDANVTAVTDAVFLLTEFEVFGSRKYANQYEQNHQTQMKYYQNGNSKVKNKHNSSGTALYWWLATPNCYDSYGFCRVDTNGIASHYAQYSLGLAPAFKV